MQDVIRRLERLRGRTRLVLATRAGAILLASTLAAMVAIVVADRLLRLPSALRLVLLLGGAAALAASFWRSVRPGLVFRPDLVEIALRVERALPALRGRLASGVEFATSGADSANPLAARSVREAQARIAAVAIEGVLRVKPLVRDLAILALVVAISGGLAAADPASARTGLERLLLPYGDAAWPARTAVASLMDEVLQRGPVHPRGVVLPLRARNLTPGDEAGRVDAFYRIERDGSRGSWRQVVLTHQEAGVHERLVDAEGDAIELRFETEDAATAPERILLVPAPSVRRAIARVAPPEYAVGRIDPVEQDLGPGVDDRARLDRPALAGSTIELELELVKPLPLPRGSERAAWLERLFGGATEAMLDADDATPDRWTIRWRLDESATLDVELVDEHGLTNPDRILYRFDAVEDRPPTAAIVDPETDEVVLPGAVVPLAGEAEDDVAVARAALEATLRRGGDGAPETVPFAATTTADARTAAVRGDLALGPLGLREGDVVEVVALAEDGYRRDGVGRDATRSVPRRLRVIGATDFSAQLRRALGSVRQNAIRAEANQAEILDEVERDGVRRGLDRTQAAVAERIAAQRELLDDLEARMDRNRLDDEPLRELIGQSRDLLEHAGRAANRAVEAMAGGDPDRADVPEALDAQQRVREELADLIELLDRDEDAWLVRRRLAAMLERQEEISDRTERVGRETLGRELADLSEGERRELEQIAQEERDLVEEARRLVEELRRRAQAMQEIDPNAASGMRSAADTAEAQELDRELEKAAQEAERNRLQSAAGAQSAAAETMRRMMEDVEETRRARTEELRRALASLRESIERLIAGQENEIAALAGLDPGGDHGDRDRAMNRLVRNTESVAAEARAAGRTARRVARALDRAGAAQGDAIVALRARPVARDDAMDAEERSLALLKEAMGLAQELEQQAEQDQARQRREELIAAYRELEERQVAIRGRALELAGGEVSARRTVVEARRLGNDQQEIREGLRDLERSTQELLESGIFHYVHELMDGWCEEAADGLWEGGVGEAVTDRQRMIAESIGRQIAAIEESQPQPDDFENEGEPAQGGGGQGGPPPLLPPVAELKRLHGLQEQVYRETRRLDEHSGLDAARRDELVRELGRMQRALIELGEAILEELQSQGAPAPAPVGGDPAGEPVPVPPKEPRAG